MQRLHDLMFQSAPVEAPSSCVTSYSDNERKQTAYTFVSKYVNELKLEMSLALDAIKKLNELEKCDVETCSRFLNEINPSQEEVLTLRMKLYKKLDNKAAYEADLKNLLDIKRDIKSDEVAVYSLLYKIDNRVASQVIQGKKAFARQNYKKAFVSLYDTFRDIGDESEKTSIIMLMIEALKKLKRLEPAVYCYDLLPKKNPQHTFHQIRLFIESGLNTEVKQYCKVIEAEIDDPWIAPHEREMILNALNEQEANSEMKLPTDNIQLKAHIEATESLEEKIKIYSYLIKKDPQNPTYYFESAKLNIQLGNLDIQLLGKDRLLVWNPGNPLRDCVIALWLMRRWEGASLVSSYPIEDYYRLIRTYWLHYGNYDECIDYHNRLLDVINEKAVGELKDIDPEEHEVKESFDFSKEILAHGDKFLFEDDYDKALRIYKLALELKTTHFEGIRSGEVDKRIALIYCRQGKYQAAIEWYDQQIEQLRKNNVRPQDKEWVKIVGDTLKSYKREVLQQIENIERAKKPRLPSPVAHEEPTKKAKPHPAKSEQKTTAVGHAPKPAKPKREANNLGIEHRKKLEKEEAERKAEAQRLFEEERARKAEIEAQKNRSKNEKAAQRRKLRKLKNQNNHTDSASSVTDESKAAENDAIDSELNDTEGPTNTSSDDESNNNDASNNENVSFPVVSANFAPVALSGQKKPSDKLVENPAAAVGAGENKETKEAKEAKETKETKASTGVLGPRIKVPTRQQILFATMKKNNVLGFVGGGNVRSLLNNLPEDPTADIDMTCGGIENSLLNIFSGIIRKDPNRSGLYKIFSVDGVKYDIFWNEHLAKAIKDNPGADKMTLLKFVAQQCDFRLCTLFYDDEGQVYDPTGYGLEDLKQRKLETVIPALESFEIDPIRMLRACNFAVKDQYQMSDDIKNAIKVKGGLLLTKTPSHYVNAWMKKLLTTRGSVEKLRCLFDTGLMDQLFPDFAELLKQDQQWLREQMLRLENNNETDLAKVYGLFLVSIISQKHGDVSDALISATTKAHPLFSACFSSQWINLKEFAYSWKISPLHAKVDARTNLFNPNRMPAGAVHSVYNGAGPGPALPVVNTALR